MGTMKMSAENKTTLSWEKLQDSDESVSRAALTALWKSNSAGMYNLSVYLLGDEAEAEDAVQEAFRRLIHSLRRIRPRGSARTYLMRITYNVCMDFVRKKRPGALPGSGETLMKPVPDAALLEGADAQVTHEDRRRWLRQAVMGLPDVDRAVVVLRYILGFDNGEASEILRMPRARFAVRLHRALKLLQEKLGPQEGE
ncbi:MAG: sigma-70 family RNA polymerase sigma factor [Phycisphaerae bacterium]